LTAKPFPFSPLLLVHLPLPLGKGVLLFGHTYLPIGRLNRHVIGTRRVHDQQAPVLRRCCGWLSLCCGNV
jgi:hypothetical protein